MNSAWALQIGAYDRCLEKAHEMGLKIFSIQSPVRVDQAQLRMADRLLLLDYTRLNELRPLIRALHSVHQFLFSWSFTEFGVPTAALSAKHLGIPGNPVGSAFISKDKLTMRKRLEAACLSPVRYAGCANIEELIGFYERMQSAIVVKPRRSAGSLGVYLADGPGELVTAFETARNESGEPRVLAEEFMRGEEISVETFSDGDDHHVVAITNKITTGPPRFIEIGHWIPARIEPEQADQLNRLVKNFLAVIGHTTGPAHTEVVLTRDGPRIVETNVRPGGDRIHYLVELATGIDLFKLTYSALLGKPLMVRPRTSRGAAIAFKHLPQGTVEQILGLEEARNRPEVVRVDCNLRVGDVIPPLTNSFNRPDCFAIATAPDGESAYRTAQTALNMVQVQVAAGTIPS